MSLIFGPLRLRLDGFVIGEKTELELPLWLASRSPAIARRRLVFPAPFSPDECQRLAPGPTANVRSR